MTPPADMPSRNQQILELAKAGESRYDIAITTGLTPQRISQIVNAQGFTFGSGIEVMQPTDRDRS